jgi:regulatory protein
MWKRKAASKPPEPLADARETGVRLLARREHAVLELRHKLQQRGFAPAIIDTVLQQLIAEGLLSDHRYAEIYALSRVDKGYGPWRIRRELSEHGVSEEIITAVLKNFDNDWMAKLAALHRKRFAALALDHSAEQAAQIRFLRQRGFTLEQINHLFQSLR